MIITKEIFNREDIYSIVTDPKLWSATEDKDPKLFDPKFEINRWVLQIVNDQPEAAVSFKPFSNIACEMHGKLHSRNWGTGLSKELETAFSTWLLMNTEYKKVITFCPVDCKHVIKYLMAVGYTPEGISKRATIYNNRIQDILMFGKYIGV